ncbi:RES domain-containing protein (plasmid) [Iamia sp. SCSIO 61187]|uniref:RES domain-containing protein n=1 Tax=Iamia sp. SCSIO 61187 TaxID=2722752 RepID=UPI001C6256E6|nr:RES domain-containing protein [Iamia sp. SCSIO 61187]QYG95846.1 RES domain-containing protein [Iamia sp. SCSIO 61187]
MPPPEVLWRVGWATDPNGGPPPDPLDLANSEAGNRWDLIDGTSTVVYAATTRETAMLESTAHFRLDSLLAPYVDSWIELGHMPPEAVPAGWRHKRTWARWDPPPGLQFLDIANSQTVAWLNEHARAVLATRNIGTLTVAHVTGEDRVLTRLLSAWFHNTSAGRLAGICFPSKHGTNLQCWAIYDHAAPDFIAAHPILKSDPEISTAEALFGLKFH